MSFRSRGNLSGDLPEVMRKRRSEKNSANVECTVAVDELGAKGSASSRRALPTRFTAFPTAPIPSPLRRFNRIVMAEGGRSRFAKEKLVRTTTVRSIVGNAGQERQAGRARNYSAWHRSACRWPTGI